MIRRRPARTQHLSRLRHRRLAIEALEGRRLLVVGVITPVAPPQNYGNPEDINYDNQVTPLDALLVINRLNDPNRTDSPSAISVDTDGDGTITPRDALLIINRLNSGSDRSGVPPEERAIGLRQALEAGQLPPNMTLPEAEEMLETLENGGYYEAGDRYRNGEMINITEDDRNHDDQLFDAEGEETEPVSAIKDPGAEPIEPGTVPLHEDEDPFALLAPASDILGSELSGRDLWRSTLAVDAVTGEESAVRPIDVLYNHITERISSPEVREQWAQAVADAISNSDQSIEDIIDDLQAVRATLGDAHVQIAQMFANLDVAAIIDRLGVDLGTLARAILSHEQTGSSERDAVFAEFLGREYLDALGVSLP